MGWINQDLLWKALFCNTTAEKWQYELDNEYRLVQLKNIAETGRPTSIWPKFDADRKTLEFSTNSDSLKIDIIGMNTKSTFQ